MEETRGIFDDAFIEKRAERNKIMPESSLDKHLQNVTKARQEQSERIEQERKKETAKENRSKKIEEEKARENRSAHDTSPRVLLGDDIPFPTSNTSINDDLPHSDDIVVGQFTSENEEEQSKRIEDEIEKEKAKENRSAHDTSPRELLGDDIPNTSTDDSVNEEEMQEIRNLDNKLHGIKKQLADELFEYAITIPANYFDDTRIKDDQEKKLLEATCANASRNHLNLTVNGKSAREYFTTPSIKLKNGPYIRKSVKDGKFYLALVSDDTDGKFKKEKITSADTVTILKFQSNEDICPPYACKEYLAVIRGKCKISGRSTGYRFSSKYEYTVDMKSEYNIEFSQDQIDLIKKLISENFKNVLIDGESIKKYYRSFHGTYMEGTFDSCQLNYTKSNMLSLKIITKKNYPFSKKSETTKNHEIDINGHIIKVYTNKEIDDIKLGKDYATYLRGKFEDIYNDDNAHNISLPRRFFYFWILLLDIFDNDGSQKMRDDVDLKNDARKMYNALLNYFSDRNNPEQAFKRDLIDFIKTRQDVTFHDDIMNMTWAVLTDPDQRRVTTWSATRKHYLRFGGKSKNGTHRRRKVRAKSFSRKGNKGEANGKRMRKETQKLINR